MHWNGYVGWVGGVRIDDQLLAIKMENELRDSLVSALHSTHIVDWEQVQIATSSDENMLLLLSAIEDGLCGNATELRRWCTSH